MQIIVESVVTVPDTAVVSARFNGAEWQALLEQLGKDMADQARENIVKMGKRGGKWPQLSGWNAARQRKREARDLVRATKRGGLEGYNPLIRRRAKEKFTSPHLGYARQKERGATPGRGRHGPGERLQDTESLRDGLVGRVRQEGGDWVISLGADGQGPGRGRPSNQRLLEIHAHGEGAMPVRNPAEDMRTYEARVRRRLAAYARQPLGTLVMRPK